MRETQTLRLLACFMPGEVVRAKDMLERSGLNRADLDSSLKRLTIYEQLIRLGWGKYQLNPDAPRLSFHVVGGRDPEKIKKPTGVKPGPKPKVVVASPLPKPPEPKPPQPKGPCVVQRALASQHPIAAAWGNHG